MGGKGMSMVKIALAPEMAMIGRWEAARTTPFPSADGGRVGDGGDC